MILRISVETSNDLILFNVFSDEADRTRNPNFGEFRQFSFRTSGYSGFGEVHPDRLALVAILCTLPFPSEELRIEWPVSQSFQDASRVISRIRLFFPESKVHSLKRTNTGRHALSFSGGADSTAALAVMPNSTESVFMLRSKAKGRTLYDSEAALESCSKLRNLGFTVHMVESDFEYLRNPIGFPTDLAVSSPAILLANSRGFESVAFGTILESAYGTSGTKYRNYTDSSHYKLWNSLFRSVGLGYSLPVAGVSEVGSAILCRDHTIGRFHQSCIRGKWGEPCDKCWKCFRKSTLNSALEGSEIPTSSLDSIKNSKEVRKNLVNQRPIKHEGVLSYSFERLKGGGDLIKSLKKLVRVGTIKTDWMEKWYPNSSNLIDQKYRNLSVKILKEYLGEMDDYDVENLHSWENYTNEERDSKLLEFIQLI